MWSSGPANKNTLVYLHGMRADQMMIKCSHTEGCKPHFLAWVEHMVALSLSLYLYFFSKRLIDWICWMYVLAWGLWKCSVLQSYGAWNWQERDASMCWTSQMGMSGTGTSVWIIGRLCWSWAGWEAMVCLAGHIYTRYNSLKSFYFHIVLSYDFAEISNCCKITKTKYEQAHAPGASHPGQAIYNRKWRQTKLLLTVS